MKRSVLALSVLLLGALQAEADPSYGGEDETISTGLIGVPEQEQSGIYRKAFDLRLSLGLEYDDNILRLRDSAKEEFLSGEADPERYAIDSLDQWIVVPELELKWSLVPESRRTTRFRFIATEYLYLQDSILDYERYRFVFDQDVSDARPDMEKIKLLKSELRPSHLSTRKHFMGANRTRLRAWYSLTPERYRGQLSDDDGGGFVEKILDTDTWGVEWQQRLNRHPKRRARLDAWYAHDRRDYNKELDERDSSGEYLGVELNYFQLQERSYWGLGLGHEFGDVKSNTDLIGKSGPDGDIIDDLSRGSGVWRASLGVWWYREKGGDALRKASSAKLSARWGDKHYDADDPLDTSHFGRSDDYWQVSLQYLHPFTDDLTLAIYSTYKEQETDKDGIDGLESSSYQDWRLGMKLSWFWGWRSKR